MYYNICCYVGDLGYFWNQMRMNGFHLSSPLDGLWTVGKLPSYMLSTALQCPHLDNGHCGVCRGALCELDEQPVWSALQKALLPQERVIPHMLSLKSIV